MFPELNVYVILVRGLKFLADVSRYDEMKFAPRVLDLFCGAGGMSLGFQNAGCIILGGIESERWPAETHTENFDCVFDLGPRDIRGVDPTELGIPEDGVDILIGGPPCQGFSIVGVSKIRSLGLEDVRDEKNQLYQEYIRFLNYFKPKYFVIENVQGMKMFEKHQFLDGVLKELQDAGNGYVVEPKVLTATNYGVPQVRHRLFIIGHRVDMPELQIKFPDPTFEKPVTVAEAISDLKRLEATPLKPSSKKSMMNGGTKHEDRPTRYKTPPKSDYQKKMRKKNGDTVMNHICRGHNEKDLKIFKKLKQGGKYLDLPKRDRRYRDDIFKDKYRKLKNSEPSWTLTAHMQRDCLAYIHPTQGRSISTREAARIQSFPDRFKFIGPLTKVFRQIGNAVPPLMAEAVAKELVAELNRVMINKEEPLPVKDLEVAGIAGQSGSNLVQGTIASLVGKEFTEFFLEREF